MNFLVVFSLLLPLVVGLSNNPKYYAPKIYAPKIYAPKFLDELHDKIHEEDHENAVERWNCAIRNLLCFLNPFLADNSRNM